MINKEFSHKKIEICKLTKKKIDTMTEKYAIVLDCNGEEIDAIGFYRMEEFKEFIKGNVEKIVKGTIERTQTLAGGMIRNILGKTGIMKDEYELK